MKSIIIFFSVVFLALGAGVYFYETQIASPNAADALVKAKKKKPKKKIVTIATPKKPSRVVDLGEPLVSNDKQLKKQVSEHRKIEKSIKNTIKKSISLDIQKAVVTEISKKR